MKDDFNEKGPNALFGVDDIDRTTQDEIAILENIPRMIKAFDRRGSFQCKIDLAKAWGRKPNYPSRIAADVDGGLLVEDFRGSPPFVRMKCDGTVRGHHCKLSRPLR